jgi:translation elongation factor EF-Tu-like GTPase
MGRGDGQGEGLPVAATSYEVQEVISLHGQGKFLAIDYTDELRVGDSVRVVGDDTELQATVTRIESLRKITDGQYHLSPIALQLRGVNEQELYSARAIIRS